MIKQELNLTEMLPMEVTIRVDDDIVHQGPAHSFLRPFMEDLRAMMSADIRPTEVLVHTDASNDRHLETDTLEVTNVAIVSGKLRLTTASNHGINTGEYCYVMNVNTITGGTYLGYQEVTDISTTVIELTNTAGLTGTHSDAISIPFIRKAEEVDEHADFWTFSNSQIRLGRGNTANTVSTTSMADEIPCIDSSTDAGTFDPATATPTIATPAVGATDSDIEIEQAFDNNSGGTISVDEVGIWALASSPGSTNHYHHLIIRDVLGATVNVNDGQTLTVTYNLKTDVPATTGGILVQWNEIFYRQLTLLSREAKTIDNANSVLGANAGNFRVSGYGGSSKTGTAIPLGENADRYGIQLGSSTTNVVNTNYALQDGGGTDQRFPHGNGTDELYHSGTYVGDVETSGSNVEFTCHKVFDNQSGVGITANDIGLYCSFYNVFTGNYYAIAAHCLARFQIGGGVTIPNGQLAKAEITIQITV